MINKSFQSLCGYTLCIAGAIFWIDTIFEDLFHLNLNFGIGFLVPAFGMIGLPGFFLSLNRRNQSLLQSTAYILSMVGLMGIFIVTFLNNVLFLKLQPEMIRTIFTAIRPELTVIGITFLISAFLLSAICWKENSIRRFAGVLYAMGAIPISLPPLMPPLLSTVAGFMLGAGIFLLGYSLLVTLKDSGKN